MKQKLNEIIYNISRYTEIVISIIIMVVIALQIIPLLYDFTQVKFFELDASHFTLFLARALSLVVGIEFVKMLCKHTAETLIEVLMFATARQMVVEHLQTWETLIGVIAIAALFAIRKYLFLSGPAANKETDKL